MGSTNYLGKPRAKNGSVTGSDKDVAAKLRRSKIRRPGKLTDYGLKRIPDYTELAYKEAVSKLRYFLSGNYAPSFRSYGGSASIKNLDESDADTDKKYPAYLSTLDYKPKPRLTAKYATLYADSLKNAYTPTSNINVPSGGAPVGGPCDTTNPDVVQFIQKQEEYIEQLERESQYCRDELNNLLGKVKEVISENEHLHDAQKNRIISRMLHSGGSETDDLDDTNGFESDKTSPMKSRKPKKSSSSTKLDGPNIVFESRISELEAQLTQARIDLKKVQDENNENKRKLASGLVDSTCLDGFKRQIDNLQRDKTMLESQVSKLKQSLEQREDAEVGARHARSDTERKLREDKNGLELEIQRLKEELDAERGRVRELCGEGARRALRERSAAEQRYNAHFDELQHDLAAQYDNVAKLQLDLERQRREENDLKRELSMKTAAVEELRMELKNKTASLQADLAQAHAEKASLEEELANARLALERQQRQAKHETNRQNSEIQSLRQRLDRADADLVHARRENLRLSEQISTLEKELNMKNLSPISPEKNKKEKELSTMIESMENKHAQTVAELESMIHSQNSLMEKLTGECRLLTDKLDDANRRHKAERTQLLYRNTELMRRLRNLWCSHKKYCTTTTTTTHSLRGRTPLSGYPNSSFSEFDRTAFTSTPIRYGRSRTLDDVQANDVRYLTRYLSDLSLDRLVDSDEDSQKACFVFREELATLQRQVDSLGRSLQSPSITAPPTSSYQAPSSHAAASLRTNEHTPANTGRDYTRDDPTRNTEVSGESPNSNIREDRIDSDDGQRLESISNALIDNQKSNSDQIGVSKDSEQIGFDVSAHENNAFVDEIEKKYDDSANEQISHSGISLETQNVENSDTHNVQNENQEQYNQNYENNESNYQEMENQQYDQGNYDQNYENSDPQYQEQEYQQHYDPNQEYVQEQYDGQYEQYPDQNYAQPQYDTSAQNYENYNNDGSYQQQQSQEYPPEASQYTDDQKDLDHTEKQRSNSPSAEVPHES